MSTVQIREISLTLGYDADELRIITKRPSRASVETMIDDLGKLDETAAYSLEIKKIRGKRSIDANNYMWQLIDKIADKTRTKREDIYRNAIRENGVFDDVAATEQALESVVSGWEAHGVGWFCDIFESSLPGCKKLRLYYGSSIYDTKQMSRLIDAVVYDAKELKIETMTPDELAELKSKWGE